eukprot:5107247-Prorocentrum_lima.AAC.1
MRSARARVTGATRLLPTRLPVRQPRPPPPPPPERGRWGWRLPPAKAGRQELAGRQPSSSPPSCASSPLAQP